MIRFHVYTHNGSWQVSCFVEAFDVSEVSKALTDAGATRTEQRECLSYFRKGGKNGGFTFSNSNRRCSVVCTFNSQNLSQLMNTIFHEARHLERHICKSDAIDPYGERAGYLAGQIIQRAIKASV